MKRLLVIGAGILQLSVIKKAKEMGILTIVVDGNPDSAGLVHADKAFVINIKDVNAVLSIALAEKVDGVIHPCSEVAMNVMGKVNDIMNLHGVAYEQAITATNKIKMRKAFETSRVPSPESIGVYSEKDALTFFRDIFGDVIIKPSRNSGSRGVTRLSSNSDNATILKAYNRALENSYDNSVIIERYIDGPEFSVEIAIWNNTPHVLAVTDKLTSGSPYFVELGHSQPSQFSSETISKIKDAAITGCNSLKLNWCVGHAEIKLQENKPYIMEIGARLGGDFISTELVHLSTGIDMTAVAISLALGIEPDLTISHPEQGAAIRYFTPRPGKLVKLIVPKEIYCHPNVYQFELYVKTGDFINEVKSSLDRSGHLITIGKDVKEAVSIAEMLLQSIEYETE